MNQSGNVSPFSAIVLPDNSVYHYETRFFEMKNMLGNVAAILQEYVLTRANESGNEAPIKLYKTKEGSWYEIEEVINPAAAHLIRNIKIAIDVSEGEIIQ